MNIYIETYGCAANQNDSEIMAGLLKRSGFNIVKNLDSADLIILNSCTVKHATENKIMHRINELSKKKTPLIIAGCMPETQYEKIRDITQSASLIGASSVTNIAKIVKKTINGETIEEFSKGKDKVCLPKIHQNKLIDIVQISEGCLSDCSFCITKHARGNLHSYDPEMIIKEIGKSKKSGVKEFWLTSQDCGCYGFDINTNLAELLEKIVKEVPGNYFIRLGMMHPMHLKKIYKNLINIMKHKNIFKFLHVPIQSGSKKILKKK